MKKFKIFVEGDADVKFLHDYVEYLFNTTLNGKKGKNGNIKRSDYIIKTDGWTVLNSTANKGEELRNQMTKNIHEGGVNIVIFDADKDFSTRNKEILDWKVQYNIDFELFLFPNNQDTGDLEHLLESIINPKNKPIFDCWQSYENCLTTKSTCVKSPLTVPAKKSKIYAYMETLHDEKDEIIKDPNRNFKDTQCWDLEAPALVPLKAFLQHHISEQTEVVVP